MFAVEFQGPTSPGHPAVQAVVDLAEPVGLAADRPDPRFQPRRARSAAADGRGAAPAGCRRGHDRGRSRGLWSADAGLDERLGTAMAFAHAHPNGEALANVVAVRVRSNDADRPSDDWIPLFPLVRHAHAKFWDPDPEVIRPSHTAWITALAAVGYGGAGGQRVGRPRLPRDRRGRHVRGRPPSRRDAPRDRRDAGRQHERSDVMTFADGVLRDDALRIVGSHLEPWRSTCPHTACCSPASKRCGCGSTASMRSTATPWSAPSRPAGSTDGSRRRRRATSGGTCVTR